MFIFKYIKKIIKALNSDQNPNQIAMGFAIGALIGFAPKNMVYYFIILALLLILNVNKAVGVVAAFLISLISIFLDPIAHKIGYFLLVDTAALNPFWTMLYNAPVIPLTNFNNTIMLGSIVIGLVSLVPIFFIVKYLVIGYRSHLQKRLEKLHVLKVVTGTKLFSWWRSIDD